MTANDNARDGYDGVDALLAAITDEPLPEAARADAVFMAEHRAATADVALLREQLTLIGEALGAQPAAEARRVREPRPARRRHPGLRALALGTLAMAVVVSLVTGLAWLVSHNGGGSAMSSGADSAAKGSEGSKNKMSGDGPAPAYPEEVLACDRLVVEGTVARVETRKDDPWTRIVLTVIRSYKPDKSPSQVSFLLDGGADPKPRKGQHVLVDVGRGAQNASLWAVGDDRVAANRAWIVKALPGSRTTACPSGDSS